MKRSAVLLLVLCCGGCFESERSLYDGVAPLRPLAAGPITSRDKDGKQQSLRLALEANGAYRLTDKGKGAGKGKEAGKGDLLRFFALAGAPPDIMLVEVKACDNGFSKCRADKAVNYELARLLPGRVEWRDPDCSKTFSKLSGVTVQIDTCKFADRPSLEKALRVAAQMPWKADGVYLLH